MSQNQDKGDLLETAVRAIESTILKNSPSYSEKTFSIESKKILSVGGVRHEIDIFVRVDLGGGYEAIFVFECKNWAEKVGKNEIIVFAEKIRASNSQKGFFVARSYTADAEAQAAKEPRIELLWVSDLPTADIKIPLGFHLINPELKDVDLQMFYKPGSAGPPAPIDLESATFTLDGKDINLRTYAIEWAEAESNKRTNHFASASAAEGEHELTFEAKREFLPSAAILNGKAIAEMKLNGRISVRVVRPTIVSHFDVAGRGRALSVRMPIEVRGGKGEVLTTFSWPSSGMTQKQ